MKKQNIALFHPWIKSKGGAEKTVLELMEKSKHKIDIYENLEDHLPAQAKIKYNAIFKVGSDLLLDVIKDGELFAESVRFSTHNTILIVSTYGVGGENISEIDTGNEIYGKEKTRYSIKYLKKILTPMGSTDILIMFKSDYPIAIRDKLSEKSHMLYYLAPIVDDEERPDY